MTEYDSSESSLDDSRGNVDRSNFVTDEGNGDAYLVPNYVGYSIWSKSCTRQQYKKL